MTTMNVFDMVDTWNSAGTTFTAIKMNVTDTASAADSLLMDLQVGGTSRFAIGKTGGFSTIGSAFGIYNNGAQILMGGAGDLIVARDAADTLALRRDTNPQTLRIYNTYSGGGANYERGFVRWNSSILEVGTESAGTGAARLLRLMGSSNAIRMHVNGADRWEINNSGHLVAFADNTYDIGANGANRPRNLFLAGNITGAQGTTWGTPSSLELASGGHIRWLNRSRIYSDADGNIVLYNNATTDFNRLQFGGTTSSFPALKRNGAMIETRLADDSGFAAHGAEWISITDGVTAPAAATGRARIYVDTADGDLKVIFADGTIKTIVTDT